MVSALLTILRSAPPTDREETIVDRALRLRWLDEHHDGVPVLGDLLRVIQEGPEEVRAVALDRGNDERYKAITEGLEAVRKLRLGAEHTRSGRAAADRARGGAERPHRASRDQVLQPGG